MALLFLHNTFIILGLEKRAWGTQDTLRIFEPEIANMSSNNYIARNNYIAPNKRSWEIQRGEGHLVRNNHILYNYFYSKLEIKYSYIYYVF